MSPVPDGIYRASLRGGSFVHELAARIDHFIREMPPLRTDAEPKEGQFRSGRILSAPIIERTR